MFDSLIESRRDRKVWQRFLTVPVALGIHGIFLAAILIQNYLEVPPINEPPIQVSFAQVAPPPPPPPAPPAAKPEAPKPQPKVDIPMPTEMVEPMAIPEMVSTEEQPEFVGVDGGVPGGVPGGEVGGVAGGVPGGIITEAPPPPPPSEPLRIGGNVSSPEVISRMQPEYPALARAARVQGVVILEAVIRRDGSVGDIKVLRGLRLGCTEAAVEALRQWRFKPGMQNGIPVDVYMTLTVNFKLG
ncbi:MAG TPA: TonB family protein [Acidobacteriota bacterium]